MHRALTSTVHGEADQGACSLVLAGSAVVEDSGHEAVFAVRCAGPELTGASAALAKNCAFEVGDRAGQRWREGRAVRVVRAARGAKRSAFCPEAGYRYDGLYKVRRGTIFFASRFLPASCFNNAASS